jgi:c-di-AMP phosphodiesterase-like protein
LPDKILDETKEIILVLDNTLTDETSKRKIEKYCKKYNNINSFIWPASMRNFKDFNSILQDANSKGLQKTESKLSKIISLNIFSGTEALVKLFFT